MDLEHQPEPDATSRAAQRPRVGLPLIVVAALVVGGIGYGIYRINRTDDAIGTTATTQTGSPATTAPPVTVSDSDEVITDIPQEPSLKMVLEDDGLYVENDGNVTMSEIEVRDAAGAVVCDLGTISPGDRQLCEGAGGATDLTVYGSGPQGQPVEATLD